MTSVWHVTEESARSRESAGPGSRKIGRLVAATVVTGVLGLFGAGVATGFWLDNTRIAHTTDDSSVPGGPGMPAVAGGSGTPDVRGLSEATARQVLADSAVASSRIETKSQPYAGLTGIVIEQQPAFGSPAPEVVTLTVSVPAAVPEIAGRGENELRTQLLELGTQLTVNRRYVPGTAPGTVLDITPPAGSPLTDKVSVTVADTAATAYLANVKTSRDGCSTGSYTQAGPEQGNALSCSVSTRASSEPRGPLWEFGGGVEDVDLTVGLPTDAKPGSSARVEMYVDGQRVAETEVAFGSTVKLARPTPGAMQFMLVFTAVHGDPGRITVTGSVRGSRDAIITLTEKK